MNKSLLLLVLIVMSVTAHAQKKTTSSKKPVQPKTASHAKSPLTSSISKGQAVYMKTCVSCHQKDGGGVQNMNPPLIKTSFVSGDKEKLISIVLHGLSRQEIDGDTYNNVMPPFNALTDDDIANVLTYVRRSFGNKYSPVTPAEVKAARSKQ